MGIFDSFKKKRAEIQPSGIRHETPLRPQQATYLKWQIGDKIQNRYEIFHILGGPGKSGMGIVYICYDHESKEAVAVKTPQDKFLPDRAAIERFKWEAETWVRLEKHYNIVQAKYVDEIDYRPCIFMEYVVGNEYGANLSGWIHSGGLGRIGEPDIPLILDFAIQFCHGMIHAEKKFQEMGKPFIHRDIKPQNIMVTQDKVVKITDFGLVKVFADGDEDIPATTVGDGVSRRLSLSKSGNVCGTPPYMSPEQCRGEKDIDIRSDIYAFGCVLHEMLTRRFVFDGVTLDDFIQRHLGTKPVSPNVYPVLDAVVMKCLGKRPADRYADFKEIERALSTIFRELTGEDVREPDAVPLELWELNNKGVSLFNLGFLEEAVSCYREALRTNLNDSVALNNLGLVYKAQGKLDEAVLVCQEALKINPNYAGAHNNLGVTYIAQGKLDEAVKECWEALRINPDDAMVHNNLGLAYKAQGKLDEAVREYREALRINPNYAQAHNNLGVAYDAQGKLDKAISECRQALKINPNYAGAHNNLGVTYIAQGKLDEAVKECWEALRIDPSSVEAHLNLGVAYDAQGKLDEAISEYREALKIKPDEALAHNNLGKAYDAQGKLDEAVREYREALRTNPDHAGVHTNLGIVYEYQGKLDEALKEYREALRINPDDARTHRNLGIVYDHQGKLDEAVREYREALRINPNYAKAHYSLGRAYHAQGKDDEAIREYREAVRINPNDSNTHYFLAHCIETIGKRSDALEQWKRYLAVAWGVPDQKQRILEAQQHIKDLEKKRW